MGGVKSYETERAKGRGDYVKEYKTKKRSNGENIHFSEKRRSMDLPLFLLDISTKQDKKSHSKSSILRIVLNNTAETIKAYDSS